MDPIQIGFILKIFREGYEKDKHSTCSNSN